MLTLVGSVLDHAEMAARPFLGEDTIKTHLGNVFVKQYLRDRAAAVAFAFDHGLIRQASGTEAASPLRRSASIRLRLSGDAADDGGRPDVTNSASVSSWR